MTASSESRTDEGNCPHCGFPCDRFEPTCSSPGFHAPDRRVADRREHTRSEKAFTPPPGLRAAIIEEVAKHIEDAPLTYMGPDPGGVRDLKFLIVAAIRDMKGA